MPTPVEKPQEWDKVVAAAWCIVLGQSAEAAARTAGVAPNSVRNWAASPWWPEAYAEARARVPEHFAELALGALGAGLKAYDQATARYVADRVVEEMAPPQIRQKVEAEVTHRSFADMVAEDDGGDDE